MTDAPDPPPGTGARTAGRFEPPPSPPVPLPAPAIGTSLAATALGAPALYELLEACEAAGTQRQALLLRLSCLPHDLTRPHHLRLARAALDGLLRADRAQLYRLSRDPACDLVVVWRSAAAGVVEACLAALRELFAGITLARRADQPAPALIEVLQLPRDTAVLLWAIDTARTPPAHASAPETARAALDTVGLATLEARLARADVARFARRRDICAIDAEGRFALRWEKRFLSVGELFETLAPDRAAEADPWLFRRLTRTLDTRMLALLSATGELAGAGPFGINLNVASILAPEFLRFDAALPASLRGRVVLDLLPPDVLADPAAFLFARDFAHARGYRLLLRAVTAELLDVLPLGMSGLDLLQLRWSPALQDLTTLPSNPQQIVLADVDRPEAIAWGRASGIGLFAGPVVARGGRVPARLAAPQAPAPRTPALGAVSAEA